MQRVLIIGIPGGGKSTFARRLAEVTKLPLVHLDREFWQAGWRQPDPAHWELRQIELAAGEQWIIEGNYDRGLPLRLPRADTVILFDIPRLRALWRVGRRIVTTYGRVRPDMAEGCPEQIDPDFIKYIWRFPSARRPRIDAALQAHDITPLVFKSDRDSARYLASLRL